MTARRERPSPRDGSPPNPIGKIPAAALTVELSGQVFPNLTPDVRQP